MRQVQVTNPSFPETAFNEPLPLDSETIWQVVCGDTDHWRCGFYSPLVSFTEDISELEKHDCPELFLLVEGNVSLLLADESGERIQKLQPLQPVLVTCRHAGFCPDGPHTGRCIVIERDAFTTTYSKR